MCVLTGAVGAEGDDVADAKGGVGIVDEALFGVGVVLGSGVSGGASVCGRVVTER